MEALFPLGGGQESPNVGRRGGVGGGHWPLNHYLENWRNHLGHHQVQSSHCIDGETASLVSISILGDSVSPSSKQRCNLHSTQLLGTCRRQGRWDGRALERSVFSHRRHPGGAQSYSAGAGGWGSWLRSSPWRLPLPGRSVLQWEYGRQ